MPTITERERRKQADEAKRAAEEKKRKAAEAAARKAMAARAKPRDPRNQRVDYRPPRGRPKPRTPAKKGTDLIGELQKQEKGKGPIGIAARIGRLFGLSRKKKRRGK